MKADLWKFPSWLAAPWVILVIGIALTLAAGEVARRGAAAEDRQRFEDLADRAALAVSHKLDTVIALLRGGAGLIRADESVDANRFKTYVDAIDLTRRYPGVRGLGFAIWLDGSPVAARRLLPPDVALWPKAAAPDSAIVFLQPQDERNRAALGYDMFSESTRRAAMRRSRQAGAPIVSGRVLLVQEITSDKQPGFIIYLPVDHADPRSPRPFAGWIYAPLRARDFFRAALNEARVDGRLHIVIHDGEVGGSQLFATEASRPDSGGLSTMRKLEAPGREWTMVVSATDELPRSDLRGAAPVWLAGLALTLSLAFASWLQAHALRRAHEAEGSERAAKERVEVLLKDVNHRVSNSLQLTASLIEVQRGALDDPDARAALEATHARVMAVARVHERLYASERADVVDLRAYLAQLLEGIEQSQAGDRIRLKLIGDALEVAADKAVAAGVIVAELVTNAIKYAYPGGVVGEVRVRLVAAGGKARIAVEDDGVGLPATRSKAKGTGLGLTIVRAMTRTLDGDLDTGPIGGGARTSITFPIGGKGG